MDFGYITQKLLGREIMVRLSYLAYRCGIPVATPMRGLDPPRNNAVLFGEYIRASSLELIAREINEREIPGAVAEIGVFRGEFARLINLAFPERPLYLFDTFDGFPEADMKADIQRRYTKPHRQVFTDTSIQLVMSQMKFKDNCIVKQGVFPKSAESCTEERFAFVSIDADLYNPIYEGLTFFYPRLSVGGYIFVHDYNNCQYRGAKQAVRNFCAEEGISFFPLSDSSGSAVISK
jgi:O-methyltransferase